MLKTHFIEDTPAAGDRKTRRPGDKETGRQEVRDNIQEARGKKQIEN